MKKNVDKTENGHFHGPFFWLPFMGQIADELPFAALSIPEFENAWCSCDFRKVTQEAKIVTFISGWLLCVITMKFGTRGCLTMPKTPNFQSHILIFCDNALCKLVTKCHKDQSIGWGDISLFANLKNFQINSKLASKKVVFFLFLDIPCGQTTF